MCALQVCDIGRIRTCTPITDLQVQGVRHGGSGGWRVLAFAENRPSNRGDYVGGQSMTKKAQGISLQAQVVVLSGCSPVLNVGPMACKRSSRGWAASTPAPHYLSTLLGCRLARRKLNFRVRILEPRAGGTQGTQYLNSSARTGKGASAPGQHPSTGTESLAAGLGVYKSYDGNQKQKLTPQDVP